MKNMGLFEVIEEIRKKPEHIRMRYVWSLVGVSMILVLIIWYFSFKSGIGTSPSEDIFTPEQIDALDNLNVKKQSLEEATDKLRQGIQPIPQNANGSEAEQVPSE